MTLIANMFEQGIAYGALFQTLSGLSSLVAAGVRLGLGETPLTQRRILEGQHSALGHALLNFPMDPLRWASSLLEDFPRPITNNPDLRNVILHSRWVLQDQRYMGPSGQGIYTPVTNAGTHQPAAPDWMLPLILGLSGDITPELRIIEDGSQKKKGRSQRK
ncbi:minor capsid protein [Eptesicus serotinus polyomavirus 1]|nr:minor capsid protein [Eptesicus serotinus polyomavirus 1]